MTISCLISLILCDCDSIADHNLAFPDYSVTPTLYRVSQ